MSVQDAFVAGVSLLALTLSAPGPVRAQQADAQQHDQHHPAAPAAASASEPQATAPAPQAADAGGMMARMKASGARLDALVTKMNAAKGEAKTEAIAELLTALVEDRRQHLSMMSNMAGTMPMMRGRGQGPTPAPQPQK